MPELEITRKVMYEKEFEYLGQTFKVEYWMTTGFPEGGGRAKLIQDIVVTHTEAVPLTESIDPLPVFMIPAEYMSYRVEPATVPIERDRIAHRLRPYTREVLKLALNTSWVEWVSGLDAEEEDDTLAFQMRTNRSMFLTQRDITDFANLVNDWLIGNINSFFSDWECPDEYEDCPYFHLDEWDHVELFTGQMIPERFSDTYAVEGEYIRVSSHDHPPGSSWAHFCHDNEVRWCGNCDEPTYGYNMEEVALDNWWCDSCTYYLSYCERCDNPINTESTYEIYEYNEQTGDDEYFIVCPTCHIRHERGQSSLSLLNYTYKPDPVFFEADGKKDNRMYFGLELEVARSTRNECRPVNSWIKKAGDTGIFYCKSDSSVSNGFEIVTHPFSYEWAKSKFPYSLFDELLALPGILPEHQSAGTHIHLSKDGFTSPGLWKFIKFHMDLPDFAGIIGERGATADYGSLKRETDIMKAKLKDVAMKKGKDGNLLGMSRSVGINLQPRDTVELRYLAGNVRPEGIRKNIEWVEAVLRFTDIVSVANARKGALKDPGYFLGWLEDQDEFETLKVFMQKSFPTPKKLEV